MLNPLLEHPGSYLAKNLVQSGVSPSSLFKVHSPDCLSTSRAAFNAGELTPRSTSPVEVLNDIDRELINFFTIVKNKPEKLIQSFEWELVSRSEFTRLAVRLSQTKCKWLLSSYDTPEVRQMYEGYDIVPIQSFSGMKKKKNGSERVLNKEVLIANFNTLTNDLLQPNGSKIIVQKALF